MRLVFIGLVVVPLVAGVVYAAAYSVGAIGLLADGLTLAPWQAVLTARETWESFGLTVAIAAAVVLLSLLLALTATVVGGARLDGPWRTRLLYVPVVLPGVVLATMVLATSLQLPGAPLIGDRYALGIIVAHVLAATPFLVLVLRSVARSERLEALTLTAASLGAGPRQQLTRVALPLLVRRSVPALALVFFLTAGAYEIPLVLGRQSPQMLTVLIMRKVARFDLHEKPQGMALATLYVLAVTAAIGVLVHRFMRERRI